MYQTLGDQSPYLKCLAAAVLFMLFLSSATAQQVMAASADDAAYTAGLQAVRAGDNRKAVTLFSQAIDVNPRDFRYYNDRGIAYKASGNLDKALEDYSKALAIKPDYPNALNNRGLLFVQQGELDKAIEDFRNALQYGGFKAKIHTNLGMAYARKGDHEAALKAFQTAMRFRPMDPRAFFFMAQSLEKTGKSDQALKMYQVALGVVKDPTTEDYIEKRIVALAKETPEPQPQAKPKPPGSPKPQAVPRPVATHIRQVRAPLPPAAPARPAPRPAQVRRSTRTQREIVRARAVAVPPVKTDDSRVTSREPLPTTLVGLDRQSRSRALKKFSANAAEIFRQGMQFLDQSDPKRAVIRFEDTLQLEKRNGNAVAVAWSLLQAGRAYQKIGDRIKASSHVETAFRIFHRLESRDEMILALVDMAAIRKAAGQKEQASKLLSQALSEATTANNREVASVLRCMIADRMPCSEKRTTATSTPRKGGEKLTSGSDGSSTVEARLDLVNRGEATSGRRPETKPAPGGAVAKEQNRDVSAKTAASPKKGVVPDPAARGAITWGRTPVTAQKRAALHRTPDSPAPTSTVPEKILRARGRVALSKPVTVETGVGGKHVAVVPGPAERSDKKKQDLGIKRGARSERTRDQLTVPPQRIMSRLSGPTQRLTREERREAAQKRITADLADLKRFKAAGDETSMIVVLERLARRYVLRRQYDKALHGLTASLALREKLGLDGPSARLFDDRGALKQQLNDSAGALEDLTRALVLSQGQGKSSADTTALEARCLVLSRDLGLDPATALRAYRLLWQSRQARDGRGETDALHAIGTLYDKAQKHSEALNYYERSAASVLTDKARVYEKQGNGKLAEQSYKEALETFKRLDYSRYLAVLNESGLDSGTRTRSGR